MIARGVLSNRLAAAVRITSRNTAVRKTACTTHRARSHETSMMQSTSCLHHRTCATWHFGRAAYVVPPSPAHRSLERRTDPRRAECAFRQHNPIRNVQQRRSAAHCSSVSSTQQTSEIHIQNGASPGFARRTSIKDVKGGPDKGVSNIGSTIDVRGWVRTVRHQKSISFIEVNDGSTLSGLQVLVEPDTEGYWLVDNNTINTGSAVRVQGELVESPARGQLVEMKATAVHLIGGCNQETYPLQKKRHSLVYLRTIPHLRPRTNTFGAVTRVRSALAFATHQFFRESGFQYIHTPILSASDCEGAGEMFQVTTLISKHDEALAQGPVSEQDVQHLKEQISKQKTLKSTNLAANSVMVESPELNDQEKQATQHLKQLKQQVVPLKERVSHYKGLAKTPEGLTDYSQDFFGKPTFLTVSGQLNAEMYATAMSDVYTFGPTFRAENSNTSRHLAEFWMIEPEMAFADLSDDMKCAEAYLKHCLRYILDNCSEDLEFFAHQNDKALVQRLQDIVAKPFARLSYTDAVELLQKAKKRFTFPVKWGSDLQSEHERYLTETEFNGTPLFITDYPKDIKAFYMRLNPDEKTVAAMDLLVPGVGELIGGSQREERLQVSSLHLPGTCHVTTGGNKTHYHFRSVLDTCKIHVA
ncbi:TPA: hypothetical protein ACH3X3_011790 [Trebouxia sp. C0006]